MSVKRLVPLHAVALATNPSEARMGDVYYNTQEEELRFHDGTEWHSVGGGAITGLLDHIHQYDGEIFSVGANEIPSDGTIDGGTTLGTVGEVTPVGTIDGGITLGTVGEEIDVTYDGGTP
jgi:hypothetical protein